MNRKPTVAEYLLRALKDLGVKRIFGIPGDMVIRFFKVIEDDPELVLYTFCHEPGVGFAAIGSARSSRRPAVACITYGAGGLNMLNSVACAYAEKTPLIVISGGPGVEERRKHVFLHHVVKDFDSQLRIYREVTQEAVILDSPETACRKIRSAVAACQEFMLPVYIEIPRDIVDKEIVIPEEESEFFYTEDRDAVKKAADEILLRVDEARMPVILAGVEADRFSLKDPIMLLARRLNVPVVTSFLSRDIIPTEDPNYFGTYLGLAGDRSARELVEGSDCLLMLGAIIVDMNLGIKLRRLKPDSLIQCVSRQVIMGHHAYSDVPLRSLLHELLSRDVDKKNVAFPQKTELVFNKTCKETSQPITIREVIDAVNWFFSEFGKMPIVSDTGDCLFATTRIETPMVMASAYYASMGFGTPAAIGYAVTSGTRPLVFLGDGAFQMTGQEMCHCPRFGVNPIFVVFNNRRWGMQQIFYPEARFNELVNWPYSKIAELWGGKGYPCDTCQKLRMALEDAHNNRDFSLIEVILEKGEVSDELLGWIKELKGEER